MSLSVWLLLIICPCEIFLPLGFWHIWWLTSKSFYWIKPLFLCSKHVLLNGNRPLPPDIHTELSHTYPKLRSQDSSIPFKTCLCFDLTGKDVSSLTRWRFKGQMAVFSFLSSLPPSLSSFLLLPCPSLLIYHLSVICSLYLWTWYGPSSVPSRTIP